MKKWEEEQRKKNHLKKVGQAKSTIGASAKQKGRTSSQFSGGAQSTHNTTQILAISNGMPIPGSVNGSAYSKGPGSLSSNSKMSRGFQTNPHGSAIRNKSPSSHEVVALKAQFGTPKVSANQAMIANRRRQYLDTSGISRKELPNLPIYQLLRAFNLQQYALKLAEKGYGSEVYKLALLTPRQREDLVSQLKVLPGHNAKLAAFFTVCDQMYPRQKVIEQIKAFTPTSRGGYKGKRVTSATGTRYDVQNVSLLNQVGPQRTLMQKYDQLDKDTKKQFNQHFMASLESAMRGHTSISQFIQQSTGMDQANAKQAMNDIFPPQFYTYGSEVISGMNTEKVRNEVDSLVKRFTKGTSYALQQEEARLQRELATAKADIDQINMEVEQNLKRSAIVEKHSAKKNNNGFSSGTKNHIQSGPFQRAKSNQEALRAQQQLGTTQPFVPQGQLPQFIVGPHTSQNNSMYRGPFNSNKITNQTQQVVVGSGLQADKPPTTGYNSQNYQNYQNLEQYKKEVGIYGGSEAIVHDQEDPDDGTRQISIDFQVGNGLSQQSQPDQNDNLDAANIYENLDSEPSQYLQNQVPQKQQSNELLEENSVSVQELVQDDRERQQTPLILDDDDTDCDALIEDSQNLDEVAVGLLGDPKKLSEHLKNQYESIVNKNASLRANHPNERPQSRDTEDLSRQAKTHEAIAKLARKSTNENVEQIEDEQEEEDQQPEVIIDEQNVEQFGLVPDEEEIQDEYADDINDFVDSEPPSVNKVNSDTPNLDAVKAEINLENQRVHKGIHRQTEESANLTSQSQPEETTTKDSDVAQNEPNNSDILWPSQQPEVVQSEQDKQVEIDQARKEKELALARKRELFNQQFPTTVSVPSKNKQPSDSQNVRWDPLIEKEERDEAWNLGHSLDSKKVTSALGYLDLKQICYCLAQALNKHIVFSQGFFFLGELQSFVKQTRINNSAIKGAHTEQTPQYSRSLMPQSEQKPENKQVEDDLPEGKDPELEFTYNLGDKFRIDIEGAKQRQNEESRKKRLAHDEATEESKKNFEELKRQMEESMGTPIVISEKLQSSVRENKGNFAEQIGQIDEDSPTKMDDGIEDEIGDSYREDFDGGIEDDLIHGNSTAAGQKMVNTQKPNVNSFEQAGEPDMQAPEIVDEEVKQEENQDYVAEVGEGDSDLDLDYSQTHLEDFLKSQTSSSLMKGSNIQSGQLLNSFITTYNKMKGSTGGGSNTLGQTNKNTLSQSKKNQEAQMKAIEENSQDGEGSQTYESKKNDDFESDDEEFLGRNQDEIIDLEHVSVKSSSPMKKHKAIISKEEAEQIRKDIAKKEEQEPQKLEIKPIIDPSKEKPLSVRNSDLDSSDDEFYSEQQLQLQSGSQQNIQLNMTTKAGAKEAIKFKMRVFDYRYDFKTDEFASYADEEDQLIPGMPGGPGGPQAEAPTLEELYYYCKYVIISGRMEKEIPILCLIYLERFFTKTGILMTGRNWKRLTLISLILASKIWDDDSLENVHFPQVMSDISIKEIAGIEAVFLQMIDFDLVIRGAEYAKYYFILKTFAEQFKSTLPMGPITVNEMSRLQNNTVKAESDLREKYNVKLALKKTM